MPYEILGHTADVRLKVRGKNIEELFKHALIGMMKIIKEEASQGDKVKRIIEAESSDKTELLVEFLNEALYMSHINYEIYTDLAMSFEDHRLKAELTGVKVGKFDEDIKAVTYYEVEIKKNEKGELETIIVFDI